MDMHIDAENMMMAGDDNGGGAGSGDGQEKENRPSLASPGDSQNSSLGPHNNQVVTDEATLNQWVRQVSSDTDLHHWSRHILVCLSAEVDRRKWSAPMIVGRFVGDDSVYGFTQGTYYKYRDEAIESGWVEEISEQQYNAGSRKMWAKVYRLTFKEC